MTHSVLIHLLCRFSFPSLLPNLVLLFGRNQLTGLSGLQFLILYPASSSSASSASSIICYTIFVTHHHSHNILSPTFHTPFLSHSTFYTQSFSNTTLHIQLTLSHTPPFTHNFLTHYASHTIFAICFLCESSFTHSFVSCDLFHRIIVTQSFHTIFLTHHSRHIQTQFVTRDLSHTTLPPTFFHTQH